MPDETSPEMEAEIVVVRRIWQRHSLTVRHQGLIWLRAQDCELCRVLAEARRIS